MCLLLLYDQHKHCSGRVSVSVYARWNTHAHSIVRRSHGCQAHRSRTQQSTPLSCSIPAKTQLGRTSGQAAQRRKVQGLAVDSSRTQRCRTCSKTHRPGATAECTAPDRSGTRARFVSVPRARLGLEGFRAQEWHDRVPSNSSMLCLLDGAGVRSPPSLLGLASASPDRAPRRRPQRTLLTHPPCASVDLFLPCPERGRSPYAPCRVP